ncbi:hypothetical protein MRX96_050997 [Rhipicephalus microplus]
MGELTQRLVSISDARDSGEPTPADPPQADYGATGEPSCKPLPPSAVSVISCSGHQHDNMHVQITIKCPCSRSSTADASTQVQATPDAPAKGQDTLDTAEDQTILDSFEDGLNPSTDARRYTVSDELCAIYERIESRWAEVCKTIRADLNRRYNQFVEGCRECLKQQSGEPSRDELRQDMSNVRRELIAEMKDVFRSSCEEFDKWRVWYLERELQQTFSEMQDGDRLSVMAAVLRYEILEGLPELEKHTRERAAALWKELVEEQWIDVDALFDS